MRRFSLCLVAIWSICFASPAYWVSAQTTDLENGVYVDPLTGFSVFWDPGQFESEVTDIGGVHLTESSSDATLVTTSAADGKECVGRRAMQESYALPMWTEVPTSSELPDGTFLEHYVSEHNQVVQLACVPIGEPSTATQFVMIEIVGPEDRPGWDNAIAAWQPVLDAIVYPDPLTMTNTGIVGNVYTDPLYGWSVQFDPARYEAQYAAGTADSPFLSGIYFYAEETLESGGIWAERHDTFEDCLEAQREVNAGLSDFKEVPEIDITSLVNDAMNAAIYSFEMDESLFYLNFAACQPVLVSGSPVDGVFLVTSFIVPDHGIEEAIASWTPMLESLTFSEAVPNGTPIG